MSFYQDPFLGSFGGSSQASQAIAELDSKVLYKDGSRSMEGTLGMGSNLIVSTSGVEFKEELADITPVAGEISVFARDDKNLWMKDDVGTISQLNVGGIGDVSGPGSSLNNTIPRWDGITGKLLKTTTIGIDDIDVITGVNQITAGTYNGNNVAMSIQVGAPLIKLENTIADTYLSRPNSGSDWTLEFPNAAPLVSNSLLSISNIGIASWLPESSLVLNPLGGVLDADNNDIINISDANLASISSVVLGNEIDVFAGGFTLHNRGSIQFTEQNPGTAYCELKGSSTMTGISYSIVLPSSGPVTSNSLLSVSNSGISTWKAESDFVSNPLTSNLDCATFDFTDAGDVSLQTISHVGGSAFGVLNSMDMRNGVELRMFDTDNSNFVGLRGAVNMTTPSYSLKMPSNRPADVIPASGFSALVSNVSNVMSWSFDISYYAKLKSPVTANVGDLMVATNVGQYFVEIDSAPETVQEARFSGMIDGVIPSSTLDVCQIFAVDGNTTFDVLGGDILHTDESNPQAILHQQKTVPEFLAIACTELGGSSGNVFIYIDARSTPITVADIIQRTTSPASKATYEIYIGNLDLKNGNSQIQRSNPFSESCYSIVDTLNQIAFAKNRNLSGCVFSDTGVADLSITHTAGEAIRIGVNTVNNVEKPDRIGTNLNQFSFVKYHYINAAGDTIISTLPGITTEPTMWDNAGVLTAVSPVSRWTIQYIYFFYGSNTARFSYGTQLFNTLADSKAAVTSFGPQFASPSTKEAVLRGAYISQGSSLDNTDTASVAFITLSG